MKAVRLGDIAEIERKTVSPEAIVDGTTYVGLENIVSGGQFQGVGPVENGDLASSKFSFSEDHILYGKLRPYLAKIAVPSFSGVCSTDILPIRVGVSSDRMYVTHFLRQQSVVDKVNGLATGANLPRVNPRVLETIEIPLPPLDEQRRIAAILDKADELRTKRRQALAHLDTLTQSIFHSMFGNSNRLEARWPRARMDELGSIKTGKTPPAKLGPEAFGGSIPFVTPGDLGKEGVNRSLSALGARNAALVAEGSLLVCCIGATIGKMGIAAQRSSFNQQINAVEWNETIHPFYGFQAARLLKSKIIAASTSTTMPILNKTSFSLLTLPVPPLELQQTFAARAAAVERLKEIHRKHLAELDTLFASLQHRAFKGEL